MNDQRQAGFPRGGDMEAQRLLLHVLAVGGIVVIQPGLADANEFRMLRQRHQLIHGCHRLVSGAHRVGACGIENRRVGLGDGAHGRFIAQFGANCDHACHTRLCRACNQRVQFALEIGEIQMAMTVRDGRGHRGKGLGHNCSLLRAAGDPSRDQRAAVSCILKTVSRTSAAGSRFTA